MIDRPGRIPQNLAILRKAWAADQRVTLHLTKRCTTRTINGQVRRVAQSGAYVEMGAIHVPLIDVENVELR